MAIPNSQPLKWRPRGCSDAKDSRDAFDGAMQLLSNLVPDPLTDRVFVPRPASIQLTAFGGFTTPGFISALLIIGDVAYGMIATGRNAGKDEPFAYNIATNTFLTITGVTNGNSPTSPATSGDWTPPVIFAVGTKVIVTHPGFPGGATKFGWFDISGSPITWNAGDTATNALPSVPVGGAQMNNRAYFACGINGIPYSDAGNPTTRTNASQALTTNDGLAVTAIGPLGASQTSGGSPIISALVVFEGAVKMQLITGDAAFTGGVQMNTLPLATGTLAPLTLTPFKLGLGFVSPEGFRYVDMIGGVSDPIGDHGTGITVPFINALNPTRMQSASAADAIRFSVNNNAAAGGAAWQEWVYDLTRKIWHGPNTFAFDQLDVWSNSTGKATYVGVGHGINAKLWQSDIVPNANSTYTENGTALSWEYETCLLPDSDDMGMTSIVRATFMAALGATNVFVVAMDESGNALDTVIMAGSDTPTLWDNFSWDQAVWDGFPATFKERFIPWHTTIVWKQGSIQINAASVADQRIGGVTLRYQRLGYDIQSAA